MEVRLEASRCMMTLLHCDYIKVDKFLVVSILVGNVAYMTKEVTPNRTCHSVGNELRVQPVLADVCSVGALIGGRCLARSRLPM